MKPGSAQCFKQLLPWQVGRWSRRLPSSTPGGCFPARQAQRDAEGLGAGPGRGGSAMTFTIHIRAKDLEMKLHSR